MGQTGRHAHLRSGSACGIITSEVKRECAMSIEKLADESIVHFYESVRRQVKFDKSDSYPWVANRTVRDYAQSLREEIDRRRLQVPSIRWPDE
jgi:hypothetical protein